MSDNALNNDTMSTNLEVINLNFNGQEVCACCFLHTTNLTAKALMHLFDPWLNGKGSVDEDVEIGMLEEEDAMWEELAEISGDNKDEDKELRNQDDDTDGWVDEVSALIEDERKKLLETIKPVRSALMKVDGLIYTLDQCWWLCCCIVEAPGIQDYSFHNDSSSSMEGDTRKLGNEHPLDTTWCCNSLELLVWYGGHQQTQENSIVAIVAIDSIEKL